MGNLLDPAASIKRWAIGDAVALARAQAREHGIAFPGPDLKYSKQEILDLYAEVAYYGHRPRAVWPGAYGSVAGAYGSVAVASSSASSCSGGMELKTNLR